MDFRAALAAARQKVGNKEPVKIRGGSDQSRRRKGADRDGYTPASNAPAAASSPVPAPGETKEHRSRPTQQANRGKFRSIIGTGTGPRYATKRTVCTAPALSEPDTHPPSLAVGASQA